MAIMSRGKEKHLPLNIQCLFWTCRILEKIEEHIKKASKCALDGVYQMVFGC